MAHFWDFLEISKSKLDKRGWPWIFYPPILASFQAQDWDQRAEGEQQWKQKERCHQGSFAQSHSPKTTTEDGGTLIFAKLFAVLFCKTLAQKSWSLSSKFGNSSGVRRTAYDNLGWFGCFDQPLKCVFASLETSITFAQTFTTAIWHGGGFCLRKKETHKGFDAASMS